MDEKLASRGTTIVIGLGTTRVAVAEKKMISTFEQSAGEKCVVKGQKKSMINSVGGAVNGNADQRGGGRFRGRHP